VKTTKDLREFIELLNSAKIDYVIVGGHAVAFHGAPRFTGDIDFFVRPDRATAEKLSDVLKRFGFGTLGLSPDDLNKRDQIIQLGRPPNRIDVLTGISGVDFEEAWSSRVGAELDQLPVAFIGHAALIKNKRASGRQKDLADIEALPTPDP
jgi:hypothetical protein